MNKDKIFLINLSVNVFILSNHLSVSYVGPPKSIHSILMTLTYKCLKSYPQTASRHSSIASLWALVRQQPLDRR